LQHFPFFISFHGYNYQFMQCADAWHRDIPGFFYGATGDLPEKYAGCPVVPLDSIVTFN